MAIDVTVLRVFTDQDGRFGNPLGVVDAAVVEPADRQRIAARIDLRIAVQRPVGAHLFQDGGKLITLGNRHDGG